MTSKENEFFIYEKESQASTGLLLEVDYRGKGIGQTPSDQLEKKNIHTL